MSINGCPSRRSRSPPSTSAFTSSFSSVNAPATNHSPCCPVRYTTRRAIQNYSAHNPWPHSVPEDGIVFVLPRPKEPLPSGVPSRGYGGTAVEAEIKAATSCVCSKSCSTGTEIQEIATFYTDANTERIGKHRLAVLEKNSVYRMHDILIHSGVRFRRDAISILCEPTFRNTVMREVLLATTTIDGGKPLAFNGLAAGGVDVVDANTNSGNNAGGGRAQQQLLPRRTAAEVEELVSMRSDDDSGGARESSRSPRPGYMADAGVFGPSQITLGGVELNLQALAKALLAKRAREPDQCYGADDDELVVPLRLGDANSDLKETQKRIDEYMASYCGLQITKALVTGVLHFGRAGMTHASKQYPTLDPKTGFYGYRFARTAANEEIAQDLVNKVVAYLERKHRLIVSIRSEPDADKDMCLSAFSSHILDGITMTSTTITKGGRKAGKARKRANEARLPGQTLLRNDVVALLHSQDNHMPHDAALKSVGGAATMMIPQSKLPCSNKRPLPSDPHVKGWRSVLVQYGRLTAAQFATACASSCMANAALADGADHAGSGGAAGGGKASPQTMCIASLEPLGCSALVEAGPGSSHSLVCMTASEMDAVQAAAIQPWSKLFVTSPNTEVLQLNKAANNTQTSVETLLLHKCTIFSLALSVARTHARTHKPSLCVSFSLSLSLARALSLCGSLSRARPPSYLRACTLSACASPTDVRFLTALNRVLRCRTSTFLFYMLKQQPSRRMPCLPCCTHTRIPLAT